MYMYLDLVPLGHSFEAEASGPDFVSLCEDSSLRQLTVTMKVIALALLVAYASAAPLLVVKEGERQVYAPSTKQTYVDAGAACSEYGKVLKVTVAGDHKEVRLDRPGTYKITYSCTGSSAVTKTRVVIVNDFKPVKFGQAATFAKELGRRI